MKGLKEHSLFNQPKVKKGFKHTQDAMNDMSHLTPEVEEVE